MFWIGLACSQHFAGLPGGRVGGQGMAPGVIGGQLVVMVKGGGRGFTQPLCRV